MNKYTIIVDAAIDIDVEFLKENDVKVIPMAYDIGEEHYFSDKKESIEFLRNFYNKEKQGATVRSTQINPQCYYDFFEPYAKNKESVLYLSLSSGLSNTYSSSLLASSQLKEKYPDFNICCVDTLSATTGIAMLLIKAIENKEKGMQLEENAKWLEANRAQVFHTFMVSDLMFLKRGGRIPMGTAIIGTVLNIKPILSINDQGKLVNVSKKHGVKGAIAECINLFKNSNDLEDGKIIFVGHTNAEETADLIEKELLAINPTFVVKKLFMGPIIGLHVGPGMCHIVSFGKNK